MSLLKRPTAADVKEGVKRGPARLTTNAGFYLIPTGSTMLNLALSDSTEGGWGAGKISNLVGDSDTGKSLLALTMLAEVANNPRFDDYILRLDDAEEALEFDLRKNFGKLAAERVETHSRSNTIQDFLYNLMKLAQGDQPFIYVLDSFDAISSDEELTRVDKMVKARDKGKEPDTGSYKMEKAKGASELFRVINGYLADTKSFVLVVSQTRDKIGVAFGNPKTRSGGNALRFYSTSEVWLSSLGKIKSKDREVGHNVLCRSAKNRVTGKKRRVEFPVLDNYGVDDITSCIDFLIAEGVIKRRGKIYTFKELEFEGEKKKLIREIENQSFDEEPNLLTELRAIAGETWNKIEKEIAPDRKRRFE